MMEKRSFAFCAEKEDVESSTSLLSLLSLVAAARFNLYGCWSLPALPFYRSRLEKKKQPSCGYIFVVLTVNCKDLVD